MRIIDSHIHLGEWANPDFFARKLETRELFSLYSEWSIDAFVLMPTDKAKNLEMLHSLKNYPREKYRFVPWIKSGDREAARFLKDNVQSISGLKFHPSLDKMKLTDSVYADFIDFAEKHYLPLIVHCGRWEEMASSKFPLRIAEERPELKLVLAHMGGDTPKLAFQTMETVKRHNLKNIYLDTAGFREYWVIEQGVRELGGERFLFASDFPLGHPMAGIALIQHMDLEDREKELILGGNAARIFKWEV